MYYIYDFVCAQEFTLSHTHTYYTILYVWHRFHINWGNNPISSFKQLSGLHGVTCTRQPKVLSVHSHIQTHTQTSIKAQDTFRFKSNAKGHGVIESCCLLCAKASQIE